MTENAEIAKSIGATLAVPLKAAGFRKRANSFNRSAGDGLVHFISIQLGAYDPSGMHAVPGFVPDLYGRFTVNLGVHVPAMTRIPPPRNTWINDYNCHLRWRLGYFFPGNFDQWWDLRDRLALKEVTAAILERALPHLDGFPDAESVLSAYAARGPAAFGTIANSAVALDVADLLLSRGERADAEKILTAYVADPSTRAHVGHVAYVRRFLVERDFGWLGEQLP